jgi:hypothetical protein
VRRAHALLSDDTAEKRAQDFETLQEWNRQHPELLRGIEGARHRIAARLDEMSRRQEAKP